MSKLVSATSRNAPLVLFLYRQEMSSQRSEIRCTTIIKRAKLEQVFEYEMGKKIRRSATEIREGCKITFNRAQVNEAQVN